MENKFVDIRSISELHQFYGYEKPRHPLISLIDLTKVNREHWPADNTFYRLSFYSIFFKTFKGVLKYGKSYYDFDEGSLMFTAPNQIVSPSPDIRAEEGWGLFFHPDVLHNTDLGRTINNYTFFHYDVNEALHISDDEKRIVKDCVDNVRKEYSQNIDRHTQKLIGSNIELLLNYCERFYERQFLTRSKVSNDLVQRFEALLLACFSQDTLAGSGLPDVKYFSSKLNLSPYYLSDLLNKYTGKTTQEHIHLQLIDKAKTLLRGTDKPVSEIAYELGFEYPSHFTKIFKTKTGLAPRDYRNS